MLARPRDDWQPLCQRAGRSRAAAQVARRARARRCGARPRRSTTLARRSTATTTAVARGAARPPRDPGITTVDALAERHQARRPAGSPSGWPPSRPRASPSRGASRRERRPTTEWVVAPAARPHPRVLARTQRGSGSSRSPPRSSCASWCGGSTSPAPPSSAATPGLLAVIGQLQGYETAAGPGSRSSSPAGCATTTPRWLDRLCHQGEVAWLRLRPAPATTPTRPPAPPSRPPRCRSCSAPTCRGCSPPRAAAADAGRAGVGRGGRGGRGARARGARASPASWPRPPAACPTTSSAALWEGMARGPAHLRRLRAGAGPVGAARRPAPAPARRARRAWRGGTVRPTGESAGRWSLVPAAGADIDRDELAEALADQLLERWGVVFYDLAVPRPLRLPGATSSGRCAAWRTAAWCGRPVRRRLQRRAVRAARGGRAARPRRASARAPASGSTVNATDPLNLVGVVVPGDDRRPRSAPAASSTSTASPLHHDQLTERADAGTRRVQA